MPALERTGGTADFVEPADYIDLYLSACDELNRAHQIGAIKEAA